MSRSKNICLFISCFLACVIITACTVFDTWSHLEHNITHFKLMNNGLWRGCIYHVNFPANNVKYSCADWASIVALPSWWLACRALTIFCFSMSIIAMLIAALCIYSDQVNPKYVGFVTISAVFSMMVALSTYADNIDMNNLPLSLQDTDSTLRFGVGYVLGWLGIVMSVGNAVYSIFV